MNPNGWDQVAGANNMALRYDPLGRLFRAGGDTFVYDGDALAMELDAAGTVSTIRYCGMRAV